MKVRLPSDTRYRALSYCWGNPNVTKPITVDGVEFRATVNLEAALRQLRADDFAQRHIRGDDATPLWIDSICINQRDINERSLQVQQMKIIYSMASEVVVWLGEAADGSDEAFDMLRSVHYGVHRFAAANSGNFDQPIPLSWHSFNYLFVRPYWRRVWIIQEIAVADEIRVCCGSQQVNWNDIETTMERLIALASTVSSEELPLGCLTPYKFEITLKRVNHLH
jgi:hypothetical protein